jgi:hypothetical protein
MATISNKTNRPLNVPLPRGKKLHLGPGKTGEVAANAVEHPGLKKLVDAGEIEILEEGTSHTDSSGAGRGVRGSTGHFGGGVSRRSGDR